MGELLLITERLPKLRGRIPPLKRLTFCYAKRLSGAGTRKLTVIEENSVFIQLVIQRNAILVVLHRSSLLI